MRDGQRRRKPTLILVGGMPGSGKTTLAHALAREITCPAISRDEIKEGLVHADGGGSPVWGGPISSRTFEVFFATLHLMLEAGVTVVAEAAFQRGLSEPELGPLIALSEASLVVCTTSREIALRRFAERASADKMRRGSHPDDAILKAIDSGDLKLAMFDRLDLSIPTIRVDTTNGYEPTLARVVDFVKNG